MEKLIDDQTAMLLVAAAILVTFFVPIAISLASALKYHINNKKQEVKWHIERRNWRKQNAIRNKHK